MKIGNRIKKLRENNNLSQEELSEKIYVSRQTISNWENDRSYPDINSLKLLSNIFDVSLDEFLKEDIDKIKKKVEEIDVKKLHTLSVIYFIELLVICISAVPLFRILKLIGVIIWIFFLIIGAITVYQIEKIKKQYDIIRYKEIIKFYENKSLSHDERISEHAKRSYQKLLLFIFSMLIAVIICFLIDIII